MEYRTLGQTGQKLSVIGFGGIVVTETPQDEANRLVASAVARGVNYFDVAPSYGDAEDRLGPALRPHRDGVFLACKTGMRDAVGARAELESSLAKMHTDHFDLYQLHAMTKMEDVETVLGPGGAMETFLRARDEGKVKYLGFSAHSTEAAVALLDRFPFDSVLFPLNFCTYLEGNFGPQVVEAPSAVVPASSPSRAWRRPSGLKGRRARIANGARRGTNPSRIVTTRRLPSASLSASGSPLQSLPDTSSSSTLPWRSRLTSGPSTRPNSRPLKPSPTPPNRCSALQRRHSSWGHGEARYALRVFPTANPPGPSCTLSPRHEYEHR